MFKKNILEGPLFVISIGLEEFAKNLRLEGIEVIHLDWRPPLGDNGQLTELLASLDEED